MIERKNTFFLGIFISVIPFLGLPSSWKTILIISTGFALIFLSIKIVLPKKVVKVRTKKEKITPVFVENIPIYSQNNTMENFNMKIKSEKSSDIQ